MKEKKIRIRIFLKKCAKYLRFRRDEAEKAPSTAWTLFLFFKFFRILKKDESFKRRKFFQRIQRESLDKLTPRALNLFRKWKRRLSIFRILKESFLDPFGTSGEKKNTEELRLRKKIGGAFHFLSLSRLGFSRQPNEAANSWIKQSQKLQNQIFHECFPTRLIPPLISGQNPSFSPNTKKKKKKTTLESKPKEIQKLLTDEIQTEEFETEERI